MARVLPIYVRQSILGMMWHVLSEFPKDTENQLKVTIPHEQDENFSYCVISQSIKPGFGSMPVDFSCECRMLINEARTPPTTYPVTISFTYSKDILDSSKRALVSTLPRSHFHQAIGLLFKEIAEATGFTKTKAKDFDAGFIRLDELSISTPTTRSLSFNIADLETLRDTTKKMFYTAKDMAERERSKDPIDQLLSKNPFLYDPKGDDKRNR